MTTHRTTPCTENPESMAELLGDCRQTAAHWKKPLAAAQPRPSVPAGSGIHVPAKSAAAVRDMAEYGA